MSATALAAKPSPSSSQPRPGRQLARPNAPKTIASRIRSPTGYAKFVAIAAAEPELASRAIGSNASEAISAAEAIAAIAPSSH